METPEIIKLSIATQVVEVLNRALETDRTWIEKLITTRYPCNKELAEDPTIQVRQETVSEDGKLIERYSGSVLGLINGLVGVDERSWGYVAAQYELICPYHGKIPEESEGLKFGDGCPIEHCVYDLKLGRLEGFTVLEKKPTPDLTELPEKECRYCEGEGCEICK